jgi:glucokinase
MKNGVFLGVDIGGTNIKLATVNSRARVLRRWAMDTHARRGPEEAFQRIRALLPELIGARHQLAGLGVGCAGLVDIRRGTLLASPNLSAWADVSIGRIAKRLFGVQTIVDNDANAAAYGEYIRGAGRRARMFICITLGTGVGGSIIYRGQILRGADNFAGEIGHMTVSEDGPQCRCGNRGCLEAFVGSRALVASARRRLKNTRGRSSRLRCDGSGRVLTPSLIAEAARRGDRLATAVLRDAAAHLGTALASLVNIFNPDVIALSGGISGAYDLMEDTVTRVVLRRAFEASARSVTITQGQLGNDAAPIGAAVMARDGVRVAARVRG